jgi:hypothetical protein
MNDITYTAEQCSAYRPKSLDKADQVKPDYITSVINKYIDPKDNTKITNKTRLAKEISRWQKYCDYKEWVDTMKDFTEDEYNEFLDWYKNNIEAIEL